MGKQLDRQIKRQVVYLQIDKWINDSDETTEKFRTVEKN